MSGIQGKLLCGKGNEMKIGLTARLGVAGEAMTPRAITSGCSRHAYVFWTHI